MHHNDIQVPKPVTKKPWITPVAQSVTLSPQASDALT